MPEILGRLIRVSIREVWPHEANDFTPWLAKEENLGLLAETLHLGELREPRTEVPVGNFYIDILAQDGEGNLVVIENQYGPTDHTHLGQIMTYLAGQEGHVTVIWIAETFREEHRATIDWLNSSTIAGYDFFAVEVEALRIGSSIPAPRFNVVGKPNNWSRSVNRVARSGSDDPTAERQQFYIAYWSAFSAFLIECNAPQRAPNPVPSDYWCAFPIGRSGFHLTAIAGARDHKVIVQLTITHRTLAKQAFDELQKEKNLIEADFGAPLEWLRLDNQVRSRIAITHPTFRPIDRDQWPAQHEWMLKQLQNFKKAFANRIRELNLSVE